MTEQTEPLVELRPRRGTTHSSRHGEAGNGELSHSWVFVVDGAGRATLIASTGHFPPQLVK